ncbi:MAG TPA: hypothetical protein VHV82_12410 [Sporichthyaceae bacterium]|jgi:hypothetical protein|nr:hypothetical protein [Sporichthyaceae bacterium]
MYPWIWRHLPGNLAIRTLLSLLLLLFVLWLLFQHVFPWVDPRLPFNQVAPSGGVTP